MAPVQASDSAIVLSASTAAGDRHQLVVAQRHILADKALQACGLVRPGTDGAEEDFSVNDCKIAQMQELLRTRGVKKRLADDFELEIGEGENVDKNESETDFLCRTLQVLRKSDVGEIVRVFDRVEKRNRQAGAKDAAFAAKQNICRQKVAIDEATELAEDEQFGTLYKGSSEQFAEELEGWWNKLSGQSDFSPWCGVGVSGKAPRQEGDDALAGMPLGDIQRSLEYFQRASELAAIEIPLEGLSAQVDVSAIKAILARLSTSMIHSAFRRLALVRHPDKETGSHEAFQELLTHVKILTEATARVHSKSNASHDTGGNSTRRSTDKKQSAASAARSSAPKIAICAEVPEKVKIAAGFFGFSEDDFRGGSAAELKKLRLVLSATKERKEKDILREKEAVKLIEFLCSHATDEQAEGVDAGSLEDRDLRKLKALCISLCRRHYQVLFGHVLKLK